MREGHYERIREERERAQLTQQEMANILEINRRTYSSYEIGVRGLPVETLISLAKYFGVTTDYLLGLTDYREPCEPVRQSTDKTPEEAVKTYEITESYKLDKEYQDIFDLELSVRATKLLLSAGISTIAKLKETSREELAAIKNMGFRALKEIEEAVREYDTTYG